MQMGLSSGIILVMTCIEELDLTFGVCAVARNFIYHHTIAIYSFMKKVPMKALSLFPF
jgi:hypothetical protein